MELLKAQIVAQQVCEKLAPVCEKIAVAGSVRRGKDEVKDIEIVYVSKMEERRQDLFNWAPFPIAEDRIDDLRYAGFWQLDTQVKRNGSLYKRFRLGREGEGSVIELFRARPENWGLIYALRTGSGEFMKAVVTRRDVRWGLGCMPTDMFMRDGDLWKMTPQGRQVIPTPTEEAFFGALALPVFPPSEREYERLLAWGVQRGLKRMEDGKIFLF